MAESGEGIPPARVIIPKDSDRPGSLRWSVYPKDIFPIATDIARKIATDGNYTNAYNFAQRIIKAEGEVMYTRSQIIFYANVPPREEDGELEKRPSDEKIEEKKRKLEVEQATGLKSFSDLQEQLRARTTSPKFQVAYADVSSSLRTISQKISKGLGGESLEESKSIDVIVCNAMANELVQYNLEVLEKEADGALNE